MNWGPPEKCPWCHALEHEGIPNFRSSEICWPWRSFPDLSHIWFYLRRCQTSLPQGSNGSSQKSVELPLPIWNRRWCSAWALLLRIPRHPQEQFEGILSSQKLLLDILAMNPRVPDGWSPVGNEPNLPNESSFASVPNRVKPQSSNSSWPTYFSPSYGLHPSVVFKESPEKVSEVLF